MRQALVLTRYALAYDTKIPCEQPLFHFIECVSIFHHIRQYLTIIEYNSIEKGQQWTKASTFLDRNLRATSQVAFSIRSVRQLRRQVYFLLRLAGPGSRRFFEKIFARRWNAEADS
jgi:hypothetical protein